MEYMLVHDDVCEKIVISLRFLLIAGAYWRKDHMGKRHRAEQEGCCPCELAPLIAIVMGRAECPCLSPTSTSQQPCKLSSLQFF